MEKGTGQVYAAPQSPEQMTPPVYHQTPPPQGGYAPPQQPMMFDQNGQPIQQVYQQPQQQYFQQVPVQGQPQQIPMQQMPGQSPPVASPGAVPQPIHPPTQGQQYQNATPIAALGRGAAPADCPACGQRAMTQISYEIGNTTHAWALGLCCLVCLGCIPYVMNSLKDVQHKCGRCGVLLATWHRSGTTEVHIHS